jgi:hypothetical protein
MTSPRLHTPPEWGFSLVEPAGAPLMSNSVDRESEIVPRLTMQIEGRYCNLVGPSGVLPSMDTEPKSPADTTNGLRRSKWQLVWLVLLGIATVGWLVALGWVAVRFGLWFWG